jgi:hypothetical protein
VVALFNASLDRAPCRRCGGCADDTVSGGEALQIFETNGTLDTLLIHKKIGRSVRLLVTK